MGTLANSLVDGLCVHNLFGVHSLTYWGGQGLHPSTLTLLISSPIMSLVYLTSPHTPSTITTGPVSHTPIGNEGGGRCEVLRLRLVPPSMCLGLAPLWPNASAGGGDGVSMASLGACGGPDHQDGAPSLFRDGDLVACAHNRRRDIGWRTSGQASSVVDALW